MSEFSTSGLRQTVDLYLGKKGKTNAAFTYGDDDSFQIPAKVALQRGEIRGKFTRTPSKTTFRGSKKPEFPRSLRVLCQQIGREAIFLKTSAVAFSYRALSRKQRFISYLAFGNLGQFRMPHSHFFEK